MDQKVLFLCPYGGAKSLIAVSHFNRLARQAGLPFIGAAAAADTPYESVPQPVADYLQREGFDVTGFKPRRVQSSDIERAARLVTIGCDLAAIDAGHSRVDRWDDVPMVSADLEGSAAAIRRHVEALVAELRQPSLRRFVGYFLRLGAVGFGGPIALAGYMQQDLVEERRWVSREDYMRGLALAQLAPGPLAAQLAIYLGWVRAGLAGATLVALAFVLPSFVMVLAISAAYVRYGGLPWMNAAFYGIGAAVIAIILRSAWKLVRLTLTNDVLLWAIFIVNAITTAVMEAEVVSLILASGVVTLLAQRRQFGPLCITLPIAFIPATTAAPTAGLFWFFAKAGAFVFGSGLAIVPFLYGGVVRDHQWLTDQQFLDAVAVAMITPGPVVITVAFIGYLVSGLQGATVAALGVFLPCYLFVVVPAPYYNRFADNPRLKAFVAGVTAAATGAIAGAAFVLARRAIFDTTTVLIFAATLVALITLRRIPEPVIILLAGLVTVTLRLYGS